MINICQAQRQFIRQSIIHNVRIDGRKNNTRRSATLKNNVIAHLPGSSYVYMEYEQIQIYTGVKIKVQKIDSLSEAKQIILQLSSMRKLKDQQSEQMLRMQSILQERVIRQISQCKQMKEFMLIKGAKKHKLIMCIDVFLLISPHISQLQLIVEGIKFALNSTTAPEIEVSYNEVTEQQTADMVKGIRKFVKNNWNSLLIIGMVQNQNGPYFIVDMKKQQYQSVDGCFLIDIVGDKVEYFQSLKGTYSIDTIHKCIKYLLNFHAKKEKE